MLTEEEARKCWCPFARFSYPAETYRPRPDLGEGMAECLSAAAIGNRPHDTNCSCIASECMAWRWSYIEFPEGSETDRNYKGSLSKGFCGLAGKP